MKKLGVEVLITVDGERATEYAGEEGDVVSCYIASEAGKVNNSDLICEISELNPCGGRNSR